MARNERRLRVIGGGLLAAATLATRLPFRAKTLFEFDSINFAVAAFRFDLREVTPQMPGYILHVLLGRLFYGFTGDLNSAYIWVSILLSVGSVLLLWRAAAQLRGERVGIIAALIWLTTPLFWFHGEVAAIYAHEAFFASCLLYLGLKLLNRSPNSSTANHSGTYILLFVALSLAGAARQSDLLFFLPATVYVLWKSRVPVKNLALGVLSFAITSALWLGELLRESGGLTTYLHFARHEINFKTQSILFGNSFKSQLDLMAKVLFTVPVAMGASFLLLVLIFVFAPKRSFSFIKTHATNVKARFVVLLALPAFLFYFTIFFMKAGYLLNVVPSGILIAAVFIDQSAIWIAERVKHAPEYQHRLTRPIITRNVAVLTGCAVVINCLWFFVQWPGTTQERYDNENTRNSFVHGAINRFDNSRERLLTLANRALEYTNLSGIRAVDNINEITFNALKANGAADSGQVILATWWSRWAYLQLPHATTYDIEVDYSRPGALAVGKASALHRDNSYDSVIILHTHHPVLLLMRHDRPDFEMFNYQVHLERIPTAEYLDIYRIEDSTFTLHWGDRIFVKP